MKKILGLLLLLALLGGTAYYLTQMKDHKVSYDLSDSEFTVKNINDINKIFLAYKNKPSVQLEKIKGVWFFDGKYRANELAVKNLLKVFTRAKVSYIPPKPAIKNIYDEIGLFGIKVEFFDQADNLLKSYYIGGNNMDESATFFLMTGEKQPYAMHMSGLNGNLRDRFKLEGNEWRDRTIFGDKKEDIASLTVVYPKQKTISFRMTSRKDGFEVEPYYKTTEKSIEKLNKSSISNYFLDIEEKISESIIDGTESRDSIANLVAFCEIELTRKDGTSKKIKFVPMIDPLQRGFGGVESERFYVVVDNGDLLLTQNRVVKAFFRPYDYFFFR